MRVVVMTQLADAGRGPNQSRPLAPMVKRSRWKANTTETETFFKACYWVVRASDSWNPTCDLKYVNFVSDGKRL
jgi:hypothetical protein